MSAWLSSYIKLEYMAATCRAPRAAYARCPNLPRTELGPAFQRRVVSVVKKQAHSRSSIQHVIYQTEAARPSPRRARRAPLHVCSVPCHPSLSPALTGSIPQPSSHSSSSHMAYSTLAPTTNSSRPTPQRCSGLLVMALPRALLGLQNSQHAAIAQVHPAPTAASTAVWPGLRNCCDCRRSSPLGRHGVQSTMPCGHATAAPGQRRTGVAAFCAITVGPRLRGKTRGTDCWSTAESLEGPGRLQQPRGAAPTAAYRRRRRGRLPQRVRSCCWYGRRRRGWRCAPCGSARLPVALRRHSSSR